MATETTTPAASQGPLVDNKRKTYGILAGIVGAVLLGIGAYVYASWGRESTDDAQVESDVIPLSVRTDGLVLEVLTKENQPVKAGDIIMVLDANEHTARLHQAEAAVATAQANLEVAEAQVTIVEASAKGGLQSARAALSGSSVGVQQAAAQVGAAKAGLDSAHAQEHKTELDLQRAKTLFGAKAIPQEQLDHAQVAFDAARAAVAEAEAQLEASSVAKNVAISRVSEAQGRLGQSTPIGAQIAAARATVDLQRATVQSQQAALALQRLAYDYLKVRAPVDGIVSRLHAHEGQLLASGQAVAEIVPSDMYVVANFKETQIGNMQAGQHAKIVLDAFPNEVLEGRVESLSGGTGARFALLPPDNATGNFVKVVQRIPVRVHITEGADNVALRAGLSAEVTVSVSR